MYSWRITADVGEPQEKAYLLAIEAFMEELGLTGVYVEAIEGSVQNTKFLKIWQGRKISPKEAVKLAKLTLREKMRCKLTVPGLFFAHFGYDHDMYIGACADCPEDRKKAEASGLHLIYSPFIILSEFCLLR